MNEMDENSKAVRKLWLAVLARATADYLSALLYNYEDKESLETARKLVQRYPEIVARLQSLHSRQEVEDWLEQIERELERI